jgi:diguanylate cyclase (GGDEF)-like protein
VLLVLLVVTQGVYQPRVEQAIEATRVARNMHEAMLDQETGLRGFALTQDERFLAPYERGRRSLADLNQEESDLLAGNGRLSGLWLEVRLSQQAWLDGWGKPAIERARAGTADPRFLAEGKVLFDGYRQRYDALLAALIHDRKTSLDDSRMAMTAAVLASLAVTIVAGVIAARRAKRLQRSIDGPLRSMLERLDAVRQGDLSPRSAVGGPRELERIGAGIDDTVRTLAASQAETQQRSAELAGTNRRQGEVLRLAREVAGSLSLRYVLRGVCTHASAITDDSQVVVWLTDPVLGELQPLADSNGPSLQPLGLETLTIGEGLVGRAARFGRVLPDRDEIGGETGHLAVPMVVGARVVGVLEFCGPQIDALSTDAMQVIETLAVHAGTAIDAARMHESTTEMALTDVLTQLPNRRRLEADLSREMAAAMRYNRPLSFVMFDVDHFKAYNDTLGHQAADIALQQLARVVAGELRGSDTAYRYGGEEFALILRETALKEAAVAAERVRAAVELAFSSPGEPRLVTISMGVATMPDHAADIEQLVVAADHAMYVSKEGGRNRVSIADENVRPACG